MSLKDSSLDSRSDDYDERKEVTANQILSCYSLMKQGGSLGLDNGRSPSSNSENEEESPK